MRTWTRKLALTTLTLLASACAQALNPRSLLLSADRVWTGEGKPHAGWAVLVVDGRVKEVGPESAIGAPPDAERVSLPGKTLIPGLIDLHSHVLLHPYNETTWDDQVIKEQVEYRTLLAGKHAVDTLQAGFTTLRDLGTEGANYADVGIKRAIEGGVVAGPRLLIATKAIVASFSYGPAERSYRPDMEIPYGAQEATGVDEVTKAVREQSAHGADWIKFYADYRTGVDGTSRPTFTLEEMKAMVAASHVTGRKVAAHASTDAAIRLAVLAGADTIEHGYGASEATFRLMKERGTAYVPTLTAPEAIGEYFQKHVRGGDADARHGRGGARFPAGAQSRRRDRQRQRRRRLHARDQCARTGVDGAARDDADGGPARRHRGRGRDPRQGQGTGAAGARRTGRRGGGRGRSDGGHHGPAQGRVRDEGREGLPPAVIGSDVSTR